VPFYVDIPDTHRDYLRRWLTPEGCERFEREIVAILENCSDSFRDERRLPSPSPVEPSTAFELDYSFLDASRFCRARVIVSDAAAAYGVLRIVYLDHASFPPK
jgi:hypothetical protein